MTTTYHVPLRIKILRLILRPIFRTLFRLLGGVEIIGLENVPQKGAYLITLNHVSIYDPPFLIAFWPVAPEVVGAVEIWSKPGQNILACMYGGIPVHRETYDRAVLTKLFSILEAGFPLVIAPEGGRTHVPGMRRAKPGVAYLLEKVNIPTLPVGITGTTEDYFKLAIRGKRPRLSMHIGKPFFIAPELNNQLPPRIRRQKNADRVMYAIADVLPAEYRGVYDGEELIYEQTKN